MAEALTDSQLKDLLAQGIVFHQQGDLAQAETCYRQILAQIPENPEALNFLGVLTHQQGMSAAAVKMIERAIRSAPDYFDAYANAGRIFLELDLYEQAENVFARALKLMPGHAGAEHGLALARQQLQEGRECLAALQRAVAEKPDDPKLLYELGLELRCQEKPEEAEKAFLRILLLEPGAREAYYQLSDIYFTTDRQEDLLNLLREWLESIPVDAYALHMYCSLTGQNIPQRASADYVRENFDKFADSFDQVLHRLDYRVPYLVGEEVARLAQQLGTFDIVLDAGCGTGLCGPLLKPHARRLEGVDLSRNMLEKAVPRGCYDELVHGELTEFMASRKNRYGLIVCADTLIYFGDLETVTQAAFHSLLPGGRFLFTLEKLEEPNSTGYRLNEHGRYSHCQGYVCAVLANAGFGIEYIHEPTLRLEDKMPVAGFLVSATKTP